MANDIQGNTNQKKGQVRVLITDKKNIRQYTLKEIKRKS